MEEAYKTMTRVGIGNITIGIIAAVVGVTTGVISIVAGARLLKRKNQLTF